jgi:hypothetical protein
MGRFVLIGRSNFQIFRLRKCSITGAYTSGFTDCAHIGSDSKVGMSRCWQRLARYHQASGIPVPRALLHFCLFLISSAAIAAPAQVREAVIATAMRCSVIADSHQWLDCFYGSAQQMRQSLRLAPAPDVQMQLTQNPPSGGEVYDADARVSILSSAVNCGSLDDDRKWLNCYYGATNPMRSRLGLLPLSPGAPPPLWSPQPGQLASSMNTPGLPYRPADTPARFPMVSQIQSYSFDQLGTFTVVLANGQIWRQLSGDTNNANNLKANDMITISRGAIGSYNLQFGKHPKYFKVTRVR